MYLKRYLLLNYVWLKVNLYLDYLQKPSNYQNINIELIYSWKNFGKVKHDNLMNNLSSSGEDIDLNEDQVIEGIPTYSTSLENRSLPFRHVYHIDIENVSRDVVSSILTYIQEAETFKAKSEILPQMRALLNLTSKREKSPEGGVIQRNATDEKMIVIEECSKAKAVTIFVRGGS
jgi:hypothetical protein